MSLTDVHDEPEDRDPGLVLTRPEKLEGLVRIISPDAHSEGGALGVDILAISLSRRRDGMWRSWGKDRTGPPRRAEEGSRSGRWGDGCAHLRFLCDRDRGDVCGVVGHLDVGQECKQVRWGHALVVRRQRGGGARTEIGEMDGEIIA